MQSVKVLVNGTKGSAEDRVLFDSGSDRTDITTDLVKKLGLTLKSTIDSSYAVFGGGKSACASHNVHAVDVSGINNSRFTFSGVTVPKICAIVSKPEIPVCVLESLEGVHFADTYDQGEPNDNSYSHWFGLLLAVCERENCSHTRPKFGCTRNCVSLDALRFCSQQQQLQCKQSVIALF